MSDLMAALAAEAADVDMSHVPSEEGMARLRKLGVELVATDSTVARLERELELAKKRRQELSMREMPDLMAEIRQDRIGLPDVGEFGVDLVSEPYAKASISAEWEPERITAGYEHLDALGAGDLIKNFVQLQFNRGDHETVKAFLAALASAEFRELVLRQTNEELAFELPTPDVKMMVPWNTLTAFVKDWVGREHDVDAPVMDLEKLGAIVGTVVKIKPRKG